MGVTKIDKGFIILFVTISMDVVEIYLATAVTHIYVHDEQGNSDEDKVHTQKVMIRKVVYVVRRRFYIVEHAGNYRHAFTYFYDLFFARCPDARLIHCGVDNYIIKQIDKITALLEQAHNERKILDTQAIND